MFVALLKVLFNKSPDRITGRRKRLRNERGACRVSQWKQFRENFTIGTFSHALYTLHY